MILHAACWLALFSLTAGQSAVEQEKIAWRLNLAKDDVLRYRMSTSLSQSMTLPDEKEGAGDRFSVDQESSADLEYRVTARREDGSVTAQCKYLGMRLKATMPFGEKAFEFDSSKPGEEGSPGNALVALIGKSFEMDLDADDEPPMEN